MLLLVLAGTMSLSAQEVVQTGAFYDGTSVVISNPESSVAVELTVEHRDFTPGVYARYAQRLLGVRASLAQRTETRIISASIELVESPATFVEERFDQMSASVEALPLPSNRMDARALSLEEQAAQTAARIFALRKTRVDLISGELGENVFGGGLHAALSEIDRLEAEYLEMFYGITEVNDVTRRFVITPDASLESHLLCRYREDEGIVGMADLSGEMVVLHIEPQTDVDLGSLPLATEKSKVRLDYLVITPSKCSLSCGTRTLAEITLPLAQYGKRIEIAPPTK